MALLPRRVVHIATGIAVIAATFLAPLGTSASTISRTDGNDTPGPLDLASVKVTHVSGGNAFTLKTLDAFTASELNGNKGWIEVDLDVNGDKDYDYWVVVYYYEGKLYAIQGKGRDAIRALPVSRPDKRTVSFRLRYSYIGNPDSFDLAAYSVWRASPCSKSDPCVDVIPNRYPLLRHDLTAPSVTWVAVPTYSSDSSKSLTYPIEFRVADDKNGSGIDRWTVQAKQVGGAWTDVRTGNALTPTVQVTGKQGESTVVRVIVRDKQGNTTRSTEQVTAVPFDDRNAVFLYSVAPTLETPGPAFLSTTSEIAQSQTVTIDNVGSWDKLCFLGGPTGGGIATATVSVDGIDQGVAWSEDSATQARTRRCLDATGGTGHTLVLTSTSAEPWVFDGLVIKK